MLFLFNFGAGAEDLRAWHGRSDYARNMQTLASSQMKKTDKSPSLSVAPKFPLLNPKKFNPYLSTTVGWWLDPDLFPTALCPAVRGVKGPGKRLLHLWTCDEDSPLK